VSVKGISLESFVSDLLFFGIVSEIQREGLWAEGKETMSCDTCGLNGDV
jgi:hypothetical protein